MADCRSFCGGKKVGVIAGRLALNVYSALITRTDLANLRDRFYICIALTPESKKHQVCKYRPILLDAYASVRVLTSK